MRDIENYTKKYIDKKHYSFEKYQVQYRRKNLLDLIDKYKPRKILEIGCGIEPLFQYIDDFESFVAVEPSKEFYKNACRLKNKFNIKIINDLIENVDLNEKFDIICISSLLHEIKNNTEIINSIKRYLHTNAIVYANVPNAKSFHRLLAYESGLIESIYDKSDNQKKFQQSHTYDIDTFVQLFQENKYEIIERGSYFIKPFTHEQMALLLENDVLSKKIINGLDKMIKYCPEIGSEIYVIAKYSQSERTV